MISAVRTTKRRHGFTLIEIVLVLAIAAVVMAGAAGLMIYSSDERALRDTSGEIELMAKRARTMSVLHQTPYALEFRENAVRLLPLAQAGMDRRKISGNLIEPGPDPTVFDESRQINLKAGMSVLIRRWDSQNWLKTSDKAVHVWRFDPDGLCEPISVRLTLDQSFSEDTYHPLTATIRDSQLEAR